MFENINPEDYCLVILFSDGETDLSVSRTGKTLSISKNDEEYSVSKAKEKNINPKTYSFKAHIYNSLYNESSAYREITLTNNPPVQDEKNKADILIGHNEEIDLDDYFYDNNGDILIYQFADKKYAENKSIDKNI